MQLKYTTSIKYNYCTIFVLHLLNAVHLVDAMHLHYNYKYAQDIIFRYNTNAL